MGSERSELQVAYPDGELSLREVLEIVFYVREPNLAVVNEIDRAIMRFIDLVSIDALPWYYDDEGEDQPLTHSSLREVLDQRLHGPSRWPDAYIKLRGRGPYAPEYCALYGGTARTVPGFEDEASYLWCWMPRGFYLGHRSEVIECITRTAEELPFSFGYASPALAGGDQRKKQALAARHPGLDIADPSCVKHDLGDRAAGSYWMTLYGPALNERLGGVAGLRGALPPEASVDDLGGGKCRVLLGPEPEIGDVNRREVLPSYRALAQFLHARGVLHVPEKVVYFEDREGMADWEAMQAWHRRFVD